VLSQSIPSGKLCSVLSGEVPTLTKGQHHAEIVFLSCNETTHIASFLFSDRCFRVARIAKVLLLAPTVASLDGYLVLNATCNCRPFVFICSLMHRQASWSQRWNSQTLSIWFSPSSLKYFNHSSCSLISISLWIFVFIVRRFTAPWSSCASGNRTIWYFPRILKSFVATPSGFKSQLFVLISLSKIISWFWILSFTIASTADKISVFDLVICPSQ